MTAFVRVAYSLDVLLTEVNRWAPNRSKASDGALGDPSHAATASDHNPNAAGVVCARDFTDDPAGGCDALVLAEMIRQHRHPDLKYVIHHPSRTMFSSYPAHGFAVYTWRPYAGPAATELHVSVGQGRDGQSVQPYDDVDRWLAPWSIMPPAPSQDPNGRNKMNTVVLPDGSVVVTVIGTDNHVYWIERTPAGGWGAWAQLGDGLVRNPI